jgi:putative DNA primase/helicase
MDERIDFAALIEPVARRVWGEPTITGEQELRWGTKGSCSIDLSKGTWFDHEAGRGGGTLDLIQQVTGCSNNKEAMRWLRDNHLITASRPRSEREAREAREAEQEAKAESWNTAIELLLTAARADEAPIDYLRSRGIERCPRNIYLLSAKNCARIIGVRYPHMVVPIYRRDERGEDRLQGVQVTTLSADAKQKNATVHVARHTYGEAKGGYAVFGQPHRSKPTAIAEGVETGLSVRQITGLPVVVTFGTSGMRSVPLPVGSEIIICADNDRRGGGQRAADTTGERAVNKGRQVRIALPTDPDPDPDKDEAKRDWNDELRWARGKPERLAELKGEILDAPRFTRGATSYALTMEEVMNLDVPPRQYLMEPWLETGSTAMIYAKRGTFKTRLAMAVGYAIANGKPLLGWNVNYPARVLYVDGELPTALMQKRLRLLGNASPNFKVLSRDILLRNYEKTLPDLGTPEGREFLDAIIEAEHIEVLILDSLSTLIRSGVENEAESWAPIAEWMLTHRFRERTLMLVHHEGKSNSQRGTSKREDVLDTIVRLKEVEDDTDGEPQENAGLFELHFTKGREISGGEREPLRVRLSTVAGIAEWNRETVRDVLRERIIALSKEGVSQKDIAKQVGLTAGRVSQILKRRPSAAEKRDAAGEKERGRVQPKQGV